MLRCISKKSKNCHYKIFSNCVFNVKTTLSYFYATFKQWLQEVKSPYTYFQSLD